MGRITYHHEPLATKPKYRARQRARFRAGFNDTMELLDRELSHLGARDVVLQVDADRSDFRLDGMLRANAKLHSPAVALAFKSKHGPLTYPCDTYDDYRDNLRAIGLALEALRAVDRYGVTSKGEQYTGWAALPPPGSNGFATKADALAFLRRVIGGRVDMLPIESALREAEMATHPDKIGGGNAEMFKRVQAARQILLGN